MTATCLLIIFLTEIASPVSPRALREQRYPLLAYVVAPRSPFTSRIGCKMTSQFLCAKNSTSREEEPRGTPPQKWRIKDNPPYLLTSIHCTASMTT